MIFYGVMRIENFVVVSMMTLYHVDNSSKYSLSKIINLNFDNYYYYYLKRLFRMCWLMLFFHIYSLINLGWIGLASQRPHILCDVNYDTTSGQYQKAEFEHLPPAVFSGVAREPYPFLIFPFYPLGRAACSKGWLSFFYQLHK